MDTKASISHHQYQKDFELIGTRTEATTKGETAHVCNSLAREALLHALDIRKFEIDLYWRRASYFWTFIAVAFAGYVAIQNGQNPQSESSAHLSLAIASVGFVFAWAWHCANRGSKRWQENWENHVDLLEDGIVGPLYKTVLERPQMKSPSLKPELWWGRVNMFIWGPGSFSLSKINQVISLFVTAIWFPLICRVLFPFDLSASVDLFSISVLCIAGLALMLITFSRTDREGYEVNAWRRHSFVRDAVNGEEEAPCSPGSNA
jgi:hypothetical protein